MQRVPVLGVSKKKSKLKFIPTKILTAHLSLWSRFEILEYSMLIACENNKYMYFMMQPYFVFHDETVFFCSSYEMLAKVFFVC